MSRSLAVLAQRPDARCEPLVSGDERAGVPEGPEVLAWIETERARPAGRAGDEAVPSCPVRLACVFDDVEAPAPGVREQPHHVRHLPVQVHGNNYSCPRRDSRRGRVGIEVVISLGRVGEHWGQACLDDGLRGSDERVRWQDRLLAGLELHCNECESEGVQTAGEANTVRHVAVAGERGLQLCDLRPVRERARIDQFLERRDKIPPEFVVGRAEIEEWDSYRWTTRGQLRSHAVDATTRFARLSPARTSVTRGAASATRSPRGSISSLRAPLPRGGRSTLIWSSSSWPSVAARLLSAVSSGLGQFRRK